MPDTPLVRVEEREEGLTLPQSVVTGNGCSCEVRHDEGYRRGEMVQFSWPNQHYDANACETFSQMFKELAAWMRAEHPQ